MQQSLIRAAATGGILIGLGFVSMGCLEDKPPVAHGSDTPSDNGVADQKVFEKSEDPPVNADTHFAAGQLAESRGDNETAISQYRASLKQNPKHQPALYRLAVLQTELKQYPQAVQTWKSYVVATGEAASAYGNLGYCYESAGMNSEAEQAYQRGIARNAKDQTCRVNYGLLLASESRSVEAIEQFSAVLSPAEAHYNVGSVYEQQGHKEQAKVEYRKSLELDPNMSDAKKRLELLK